MNSSITFKDLFDFVLENKKDKTFIGYTDGQIALMLKKGIENNSLLYLLNTNNKICGMILADVLPEKSILFVTENLAMNLANLRIFARVAKERFPLFKLEWRKHGILKKHNTETIYKKLS